MFVKDLVKITEFVQFYCYIFYFQFYSYFRVKTTSNESNAKLLWESFKSFFQKIKGFL